MVDFFKIVLRIDVEFFFFLSGSIDCRKISFYFRPFEGAPLILLTDEFRVFDEQLRCAHRVNATESVVSKFPVHVVQQVQHVHSAQYGKHRVPEQRYRLRQDGYTELGPVTMRPRGVQVKKSDKQAEPHHFQAQQSDHELIHFQQGRCEMILCQVYNILKNNLFFFLFLSQ